MKTLFALRSESYPGGPGNPSGKPDGMFIREDGLFTDNKASAKLFETVEDADQHFHDVLIPQWTKQGMGTDTNIHIVEVEVKYVIAKASKISARKL